MLVFKVFGQGTSLLACKLQGQSLHLFGPLGNGFPMPEPGRKIVMAAGGVGLPPLYFLAKRAIANGFSANEIVFIVGAKTEADLLEKDGLIKLGLKPVICTDDGTVGFKGNVVDLLAIELPHLTQPLVYACGPSAMLMGVDSLLSELALSGYLSLETLMPCGYGICSGCAVKMKPLADRGPTDDKRDYHLKRVCIDGPVFRSGNVIW
jgi:dihydroorotate dehydrogenase electron transfer subunit